MEKDGERLNRIESIGRKKRRVRERERQERVEEKMEKGRESKRQELFITISLMHLP